MKTEEIAHSELVRIDNRLLTKEYDVRVLMIGV